MEDQFSRTRLLIGNDRMERLHHSMVTVVGCGAVGSVVAEALARTGVGQITVIDFDRVSLSNINRQLVALHSTIGRKKVDVIKERILDISPSTLVQVKDIFLDGKSCDIAFSPRPDVVVDAIDSLTAKTQMITYLKENKIPFISSMGAALKKDPTQVHIDLMEKTTVCPMASHLRKMLRKKNIPLDFPCVFSTETAMDGRENHRQMGSLITITGVFGLYLADYVLKFLIKGEQRGG